MWVYYSTGISKGHNLYLFIWCLRCQCFFVQHEFLRGRCQRSEPCWGWPVPPINSQQAFCELFCLPLLWSHRPNLWPYDLLNTLQNYSSSRSVKRCAGAQQGLSDKAIGTKARERKNSKPADPRFLTVKNSILFFCFTAVWLFTMHSSVCTFTAESRSVLCSNNLP